MNYDEATTCFAKIFYESFSADPNSIDAYYFPNSKLIVTNPDETQFISTSNRHEILPKWEHKIFRCNGQKIGEQILGHLSGYFDIIEDENTHKYFQSNEMIIYLHSNEHPSGYQILYHSIHLSNADPSFQPKPPKPKE